MFKNRFTTGFVTIGKFRQRPPMCAIFRAIGTPLAHVAPWQSLLRGIDSLPFQIAVVEGTYSKPSGASSSHGVVSSHVWAF